MLSSFCVSMLMRLPGMMALEKHPELFVAEHVLPCAVSCGSAIRTGLPALSKLWEKLPCFSRAVGIIQYFREPGVVDGQISCEKKKNILSFDVLKTCGMKTGPPMV